MEEKEMMTVILLVPQLHKTGDVSKTINTIACQLGLLNCKIDDDVAAIKFNGIINNDHKDELYNIASQQGFIIICLEAEYECSFVSTNTFHIPNTNEMTNHLREINEQSSFSV